MTTVRGMTSPLIPCLSSLVIAACDAPTSLEEADLQQVAVDSLPYLIAQVWGSDEDRPFTVRLAANGHDTRWLESQLAKPFVLDLCEEVPVWNCTPGNATMVAEVGDAEVNRDGTAFLEVTIGRGDAGPPGRRGAFFAVLRLYFGRDNGLWRFLNHEIRKIS